MNEITSIESAPTNGGGVEATNALLERIDRRLDERLRVLLEVAERLTSPEALKAVSSVLDELPLLQQVIDSGILAERSVDVVGRAGHALSAARAEKTRGVGLFGAARAMSSSLPTSRTGAAIRKQAPVLVENLAAFRAGQKLAAEYDGYASCPLVTGYGKLVLAEFDYDGRPAESSPFDQSRERYSMYALKAYGPPELYWNGMLRGRA
jgi:hypothetical protein